MPALARTTPVTPPTVKRKIKPSRPKHWCWEADRAAPHGGNPRENFNPCRDRNNQCSCCEVGLRVHRDT